MFTLNFTKHPTWWTKISFVVLMLFVVLTTHPCSVLALDSSDSTTELSSSADEAKRNSTETSAPEISQSKVTKTKKISYRPRRRLSYRKFEDGVELWRKPDGTIRLVYPKSGVGVASSNSQVQN